jgi:hypothetical protein
VKPSDGLEPSTPSLPCAPKPLPWVATGCRLACLSRLGVDCICHWLPPVAPAGLHKCSMRRAHHSRRPGVTAFGPKYARAVDALAPVRPPTEEQSEADRQPTKDAPKTTPNTIAPEPPIAVAPAAPAATNPTMRMTGSERFRPAGPAAPVALERSAPVGAGSATGCSTAPRERCLRARG